MHILHNKLLSNSGPPQGGMKYFASWEPILSAKSFARNSRSQTPQKTSKIAVVWVFLLMTRNFQLWHEIRSCVKKFLSDIEIEYELTILTYKVFSCKDVRSKFLGVRI